jgi:hypothetical protein
MDKLISHPDFRDWIQLGATRALVSCLRDWAITESLELRAAAKKGDASRAAEAGATLDVLDALLKDLSPANELQAVSTPEPEYHHPHRRKPVEQAKQE